MTRIATTTFCAFTVSLAWSKHCISSQSHVVLTPDEVIKETKVTWLGDTKFSIRRSLTPNDTGVHVHYHYSILSEINYDRELK